MRHRLPSIRRRAVVAATALLVAGAMIATGSLAVSGATIHASTPTITQGTPFSLSGAGLWLHAVTDSEGRVVLSAAENQAVEMAYFDPSNPTGAPSWKTVITPSQVGASGLADHWHIYADGHHWIVVSDSSAQNSWLFELDDSFNVVGSIQVVKNGLPFSTTVQAPNSNTVRTNDMFLVAEPNGITVAHFLPPDSNRLFRYNFALQLQSITDIGGEQSAQYDQNAGSSAFATSSGFTVIAPTTLAPNMQSNLMELTYDANWNAVSAETLLATSGTNYAMGTAVVLPGGDMAVTARVLSPLLSSPSGSDNGNIVRYLFDSSGNQLSSTTLVGNGQGNRPHTLLFGNDLITTWDNGGGAVSMEIDTVAGATTTTSTTAAPTTTATTTAVGSNLLPDTYVMSFTGCNSATSNCSDPRNQTTYLAQSNDGSSWSLAPAAFTPVTASSSGVVVRNGNVYVYGVTDFVNETSQLFEYSEATGQMTKSAVSISGLPSGYGFVDPDPILTTDGSIVMVFYMMCAGITPSPSCSSTSRIESATEVAGSDGTRFTMDPGDRLVTANGSGNAATGTTDPDVCFDGHQYVMYVLENGTTVAYSSPSLQGSYSYLATVFAPSGNPAAPPGCLFDPATGTYFLYEALGSGPGSTPVIQRASTTSAAASFPISSWQTVAGASAFGLASTVQLNFPDIALNAPSATTTSTTTPTSTTSTTNPTPPSTTPGSSGSGCASGIGAVAASGAGYWMLGSDGTVYHCGSGGALGSATDLGSAAAIAPTPDGKGYWVVSPSGRVDAFGDAHAFALSATPSGGVVTIASTPDGQGYWLATATGQVVTAGDAPDEGSPQSQGLKLAGGIVNMAPTPDGKGYWMLGSDGGVMTFGDASYFGSPGQLNPNTPPGGSNSILPLNKPAVAMASTSDGKGYWFVAADGGIFSFGDAGFYVSTGQLNPSQPPGGSNSIVAALAKPVNGMVVTADGRGYWMVAQDGGVFAFGDAGFVGSLGGQSIPAPVVGFAPV